VAVGGAYEPAKLQQEYFRKSAFYLLVIRLVGVMLICHQPHKLRQLLNISKVEYFVGDNAKLRKALLVPLFKIEIYPVIGVNAALTVISARHGRGKHYKGIFLDLVLGAVYDENGRLLDEQK